MIKYDVRETPRVDIGLSIFEYDNSEEFASFIGKDVFPVRNTRKPKGVYSVVTTASMTAIPATGIKRQRGGTYKKIHITAEDQNFATQNNGVEAEIFDEDQDEYQDDFDVEMTSAEKSQRTVRVVHEMNVAAAVFNTATFTGANYFKNYSASAPWSVATTKVIGQVDFAKRKVYTNSGKPATDMTLGYIQMANLLLNDQVRAQFPAATVITEDLIRANLMPIFGLKNLNVGGEQYNSAPEGEPKVLTAIWSDKYVMIHNKSNGKKSLGLGNTINYDLVAGEEMFAITTYRINERKVNVIRNESYTQEKITNKDSGFLLQVEVL